MRAQVQHPLRPNERISLSGLSPGQTLYWKEKIQDLRQKVRHGLVTQGEVMAELARFERRGPMTVEIAWTMYEQTLRGRWKRRAAGLYTNHISSFIGHLAVVELVKNTMQTWESQVRGEDGSRLGLKTFKNVYELLRAAISRLIPTHVERIPWQDGGHGVHKKGYKPPKVPKPTIDACRTADEFQLVAHEAYAADQRDTRPASLCDRRPRVSTLALLGLRQGEAAGLGWDDLVLEPPRGLDLPEFVATATIRHQVTDRWRREHPEWTRPRDPPKGK